MATRAIVGIVLEDGKAKSIYHHWDGYPDHLGNVLKKYYSTYEEALDFVEGGDISSTSETGSPSYYYESGDSWDLVKPVLHLFRQEIINRGCDCCDYTYIFEDNEWHCYSGEEVVCL